jgi:alanyl-tRNA synthetase
VSGVAEQAVVTEQAVAKRLYYDSAALDFTATVTDIQLESTAVDEAGEKIQWWRVALDRTAFYPQSGGQPWDTGTLTAVSRSGAELVVAVERVEEDDAGEVWHFVRKPLLAGTEVTGDVDAGRRVDHEQQHSGQHLLSAVFLRELGAPTVSFHLGGLTSTIDLQLREGMERLSADDLARVEDEANRIVREARPLHTHWIHPEMAQMMLARGDLRKLPERFLQGDAGPMRIVQMQGIEFNACGGTHVQNTGAIGAVLLRKVEKNKKNWRVEFVCGGRAIAAARADFAMLRATGLALSVGVADVPARVEKLLADVKAAAKELKALKAGGGLPQGTV